MEAGDAAEVYFLQHHLFVEPYAFPLEYLARIGQAHHGLVSWMDSRLVGFALFEGRSHETNRKRLVPTITSVGVDPAYRNLGIATMLVTQAVYLHPGSTWYLHVEKDNAAALRVYTKVGFAQEALIPGYYLDAQKDARYMRWEEPTNGTCSGPPAL